MSGQEGVCGCGCGERTEVASRTVAWRGWQRGRPKRYLSGHEPQDDYVIDENGCWVWQRLLSRTGYARIAEKGRDVGAHRVYYERRFGPIPGGVEIHHRCHNRRCVNPDHLEPLTAAQHRRLGKHSKLGPTEVEHIRALAANTSLTQKQIAERFGVSREQVSKILRGERWGAWVAS